MPQSNVVRLDDYREVHRLLSIMSGNGPKQQPVSRGTLRLEIDPFAFVNKGGKEPMVVYRLLETEMIVGQNMNSVIEGCVYEHDLNGVIAGRRKSAEALHLTFKVRNNTLLPSYELGVHESELWSATV